MLNKKKHTYSVPEISDELSIETLTKTLIGINKELLSSNQKLKLSEELRHNMFANLSHDLRSPITSIIGNIEYLLICDSIDPVELTESLNLVKSKLFQINSMIEDMLCISSLDSEVEIKTSNQLTYELVELNTYIDNYYHSILQDKRFESMKLTLSSDEQSEYYVNIDSTKIHRLLDNLYSNALKFTEKGGYLALTLSYTDNNAIISLKDSGIGIPKEHIETIFDRSFMISDARTPSHEKGCGLGLSIARAIITQHGGKIWCDSTEGNGSQFTFTLPTIKSNE